MFTKQQEMQREEPSPRIKKQISALQINPVQGANCIPDPYNYNRFLLTIAGPEDSCYQGGVFYAQIFLPDMYPLQRPVFQFDTRIFHPNVGRNGKVTNGLLGRNWSPAYSVKSVIHSVVKMLRYPDGNLDHALSQQIESLWAKNTIKAESIASKWTKKYATSSHH